MATKETVQLSLVPVRISIALITAIIGYYLPWLMLGIWLIVFGGALGVIVFVWAMHRVFRWRGRRPCAHCGRSILHIARICPGCGLPTLLPATSGVSLAGRIAMARAAIAMAHADAVIAEQERSYLEQVVATGSFPSDVQFELGNAIRSGIRIEDLDFRDVPPSERAEVVRAASASMVADGLVRPLEERALSAISARLQIGKVARWWLLRSYRQTARSI